MAVLGKTSASSSIRKGAGIRNVGRGLLDLVSSPLGALGVDIDPNYEGNNVDKWNQFSQIGDSLGKTAGGIGLGMATAGLGNLMTGSPEDVTGLISKKYGGKIYGKKGKRYFVLGGDIPPAIKQPTDAELYKNNPMQPSVLPNDNVRFLPGGQIVPTQGYTPPTPEEIARVMAETQAQALIQAQGLPQQKRYGGIMKNGGSLLTEYQGNKHEQGGVPISENDEVEDGENSFNTKDGNKYIFSDSIVMPGSKRTFAQGGKRIASKYKLREGDRMAEKAQQLELERLSQKQEFVKEAMKTPAQRMQEQMQQQFAMGGYMNAENSSMAAYMPEYKYGGNIVPSTNDGYVPTTTNGYDEGGYLNTMYKYGDKLVMPQNKPRGQGFTQPNYNIDMSNTPNLGQFMPGQQVDLMQNAKINNPMLQGKTSTTGDKSLGSGYKPAYGVPMAGYGVQALSNLPALFAKPNKVKFDRIRPETIDLSSQRDQARRDRNLQLAMAQRQAGQMNNAGQAGVYANAATSGIMGNYGDAFNQSIMQQEGANTGIKNQANAQNAETQMREQMVNQQELNNIREGKQQAVSNMGTVAAMAGKSYGQMGQEAGYINTLDRVNPDYGLLDPYGNIMVNRKRPYKCGGKMKRRVK